MLIRVLQWKMLALAIVLIIATGCGIPVGSTLAVSGTPTSITQGATTKFSAIVTLGATSQDASSSATWSSSEASVATVNTSGLVTGVKPGTATITASIGSSSAQQVITVTAPSLISLALTPQTVSVVASGIQQFTATGMYNNNTSGQVSSGVVWKVTPATVATINSAGLLTALSPGSFQVTASLGSFSASATGSVTAPSLISLALTPQTVSVVASGIQQFTATGMYNNNTSGQVSSGVVWKVTPATVATINSAGLLTALGPGSFQVTASLDSLSASAPGLVTAPSLTSLALTPQTVSVVASGTQQFTATGTYNNNTSGQVSSGVVWKVTPATVATINSAGLLTALGPGSFQVTASLDSLSASAPGSVTGSANANTSASLIASGRILNQTTFGPTAASLAHVQQVGLQSYLNEQLSTPASPMSNLIPQSEYTGDCLVYTCAPEAWWWQDILFGQDQLRQRVAFALSKLFVVSYNKIDPRYYPFYLNTLSNDAFGNWLTLMQDVSLTPAMGYYLDMGNSAAPTPAMHADENFARELMQLFSIGTVALNMDGSVKLDANGHSTPNYTPDNVQAFARAFTGFTYANTDCSAPTHLVYYFYPSPPGLACPMVPLEQYHDTTQKTLLRGTTLPANQDAQTDFQAAIANIFKDPSLPPFISRRLIQNLVTSNPSPEYIERVANVFVDDGTGVRGNLKAVLFAILMDQEARMGDDGSAPQPKTGIMRDPVLWWTSILRSLNATQVRPFPYNGIYENIFDLWLLDLGESPHKEPSVFSFYSPNYTVDGGALYAPELELDNSYSIPEMMRHLQDLLDNNFNGAPNTNDILLDLSATSYFGHIASTEGPGALVDELNSQLLHGTMSDEMKATIVSAVSGQSVTQMVENAVYLIVSSPQYRVMY